MKSPRVKDCASRISRQSLSNGASSRSLRRSPDAHESMRSGGGGPPSWRALCEEPAQVVDSRHVLRPRAAGSPFLTEIPDSLAAAIRSLGSFRKPKYLETLEKQLGDNREAVVNAAAHALGGYFGEKEETRKQIVGKMISAYASVGVGPTAATSGPKRDVVDHALMLDVRYEFQLAHARLTGGVQFDRAKLWADWYRDAKNAQWRDGVDRVSIKFDGLQPGSAPVNPGKH
jgi:hypothetical protein